MKNEFSLSKFIKFLNDLESEAYDLLEVVDDYDTVRHENQGVLDTIELIKSYINNPKKYEE